MEDVSSSPKMLPQNSSAEGSNNALPNATESLAVDTPSEASANGSTKQIDRASDARISDGTEPYRQKMRTKENMNARVVKWQRNGLDVDLEDGAKAFMPNDMIDRDSNRNVANYFGKTLPVKIMSVKRQSMAKSIEIEVSHRAVLDEELRNAGKDAIKDMNAGDIIEGKIKAFSKDNVIVDLGPGIEAVIRLRDLSWQQVGHPYEIAKRGETVKAKILSVDKGRRRVQLGVKQLTEDPEITKFGEYTADQTVTGKVVGISNFGAELELPNGLIAFLPMSEVDWRRINAVSDIINEGDTVEVKVLAVNPDDRRITVSRKLLIDNPLRKIESTFKLGTDHDGVIKEVNRGGVVVSLEHGTEGFVPRRELSHDRIERLEDSFKAGKKLEALRVIEFDRKTQKITLSAIQAEREAQRDTLKNYKASARASSYTLGDSLASLKEQLQREEGKS